jgi:molybdopterin-guanine dinucleotide biosynthesis protein A
MNFSAVILAGGKSSRMGRDKARLEIGGETLLARQIQLARETGAAEIFISGRAETDYSEFNCRVLQDKFPDAGPLAGIERALDAAISPLLLVLAVDLPEMNAVFLRQLAMHCAENLGAIPRVNGNIEPLAAFYPKTVQPLAETSLRAGDNAVSIFAERCVQSDLARFVELPASEAKCFTNWNSPADLASAIASS